MVGTMVVDPSDQVAPQLLQPFHPHHHDQCHLYPEQLLTLTWPHSQDLHLADCPEIYPDPAMISVPSHLHPWVDQGHKEFK